MKTNRKSLLKRTVALLLTICSLLAVMVPAASAEGAEESAVDFEILTGSVVGAFEFGAFGFGAIGEVNGHDYLFIPHNKVLYVYDLDTWEKVDEKYLGFTNGYGCLVDSNGIVWAYGSKPSLFRFDPVTKEGKWTSTWTTTEGSGHIQDVIEVNGKFYMGTYNKAELAEYDPATDTFTNLGVLHEGAIRVGSVGYKNGFIYASVHSEKGGREPNVVVKYDLANKKVVDTLDINDTKFTVDTWNRSMAIVGNTLLLASNNQASMCAVDISGEKMRIIDPQAEMGLPEGSHGIHNGISEVIVEPDGNEKVYFMLRQKRENVKEPLNYGWSGWSYIYEYNSSTGKATPVETFPHSANSKEDWVLDYIHTKRGCLVTVDRPEIEGWTGPSIFTMQKFGDIAIYNIASGKVWKDTSLTYGDGVGKNVLALTPGPEGTNSLYIGCGMSDLVSKYDIATGEMKRYDSYSSQVTAIHWYDGKCYAGGYGAASLCEVGINGEVKLLFELNDAANKNLFMQERPYNITAGEGLAFVTTNAQKGNIGGYLAWYDYDKQTTFVVVESDKVLYLKDSDKATNTWYDAKTDTPYVFTYTDGSNMNFKGFVDYQAPKSIVYQDGYVYGGTTIHGGSGSTPAEGASAVLFAYDVANMKQYTFDLHTVIEGLPEIITNIRSVVADPDVPGKFWGQVAGTLFSFTFDKTTGTFHVKEELSFSKSDCYLYLNVWTGAPIYFKDGFIFADLREEGFAEGEQAIRMICKDNPSENYLLLKTNQRAFALGEDNNIYVIEQESQGLARYNTADRIAEIKANKAALDAVEEKINAIGEVTLESEEAIVAARTAYDALPEEVKALVTNLQTLEAAEATLDLLKRSTKVETNYSFVYIPPLEFPEGADNLFIEDTQIAILADAYEKGIISSTYIGDIDDTKMPNYDVNQLSINYSATYGQWIAFKLRSPGTGKYDITLNFSKNNNNTKECSVYILPGDTSLADIDSALTSAEAVGAANLRDDAEIAKIGSYSFEADKEYVVVFKATKDYTNKTVEGAKARMRLKSLSMGIYVLTADLEAAQAVQAQIDAIGEVTLESEEVIKAARAAYDALTEEQKPLVSNLDALTAAEAKLAQLQAAAEKAAADKAAADAVAAKIEAIGEVTLESEEDIKAARAAYDALTEEQKALVSNLDALTAAESKLAELKAAADKAAADKAAADAVAAKIEDIGEVTLETEEDIKAARAAYDALTEEQKPLVSNLDTLTAAEAKLAELQAAAADAERIEAARDVVGKALAAMTVTNDTSKEAIQKVIDEALKKAEITDAAASVTDVAVTKATTEKAGSAKITVVITSGKGSESSVNTKTIARLIPPADPDNPQTGDETNLILPVLLMVISVMGIAVGVIFFRKLSYKGRYLK